MIQDSPLDISPPNATTSKGKRPARVGRLKILAKKWFYKSFIDILSITCYDRRWMYSGIDNTIISSELMYSSWLIVVLLTYELHEAQ
jgi:hypothetical protein